MRHLLCLLVLLLLAHTPIVLDVERERGDAARLGGLATEGLHARAVMQEMRGRRTELSPTERLAGFSTKGVLRILLFYYHFHSTLTEPNTPSPRPNT